MTISPDTAATRPFIVRGGTVLVGEVIEVQAPQFLDAIVVNVGGDGPVPENDVPMIAGIYTAAGALVCYGSAVFLGPAATPGVVRVGFDGARGRILPAGGYRAALLFAGLGDAARIRTDAQQTSPLPAVVVDAAAPSTGPYIRFSTTNGLLNIAVRDDGVGASGNAALYAQPNAPGAGRSAWIATPRAGSPGAPRIVLADGVAPDPLADRDLERSVTGPVAHALHQASITIENGLLRVRADYAPAHATELPERLTDTNHFDTGPLLIETKDLWEIPDVDDAKLADLPWSLSQRAFRETGPLRGERYQATAGWFGTKFARHRRAQAIVRTGGPLAGLVGQRIRVTYRTPSGARRVWLWVADELPLPDDMNEQIVLTRRAFIELADPGLDGLPVTVEVLG